MNVDDVKAPAELTGTAPILSIFERQLELMHKYDEIEARNGFPVPPRPYDLDDKYVQHRIKELFWRATEEFGEALEERAHISQEAVLRWRDGWDSTPGIRHFMEELADALHFLTEASIVAGFTGADIAGASPYWSGSYDAGSRRRTISVSWPMLTQKIGEVVWSMGLAANCLKNKPWKTSEMRTDKDKFRRQLQEAWSRFAEVWVYFDVRISDVYTLYHKKNTVNAFRISSKY